MGQSQTATCCCGTTSCMNSQSQVGIAHKPSESAQLQPTRESSKRGSLRKPTGKQTAIDDLQSSYKNFKAKQDVKKEVKLKVRRALRMMEVLTRFFLGEAHLKTTASRNERRTGKSSERDSGAFKELQD